MSGLESSGGGEDLAHAEKEIKALLGGVELGDIQPELAPEFLIPD